MGCPMCGPNFIGRCTHRPKLINKQKVCDNCKRADFGLFFQVKDCVGAKEDWCSGCVRQILTGSEPGK